MKWKRVTTKPVEKFAAFLPLECFLIEGVSLQISLASKWNWKQGRTSDVGGRWRSESTISLLLLDGLLLTCKDLERPKCRWAANCCEADTLLLKVVPLFCFPKSSWWLNLVIWPDSACSAPGEKGIDVPAVGISPTPAHCTSNVSVAQPQVQTPT